MDRNVSIADAILARHEVQKALTKNDGSITIVVDEIVFRITGVDYGAVTLEAFDERLATPASTNATAAPGAAGGGTAQTDASGGRGSSDWLSTEAKGAIIGVSVVIFLIFVAVVATLVVMRRKEAQRGKEPAANAAFGGGFATTGTHFYPGGAGSSSALDSGVVDMYAVGGGGSTKSGHYYPGLPGADSPAYTRAESVTSLGGGGGDYITMGDADFTSPATDIAAARAAITPVTPRMQQLNEDELNRLVSLVQQWNGPGDAALLGRGAELRSPIYNQYRDPAPNPFLPGQGVMPSGHVSGSGHADATWAGGVGGTPNGAMASPFHQAALQRIQEREGEGAGEEDGVQRKTSFKGVAKGVLTGIKINDAIELNNFGADLFGRIDAAKVDSDMVEAIERTPHLAAGPGVDIELESLGWNDSEAGDDEFGFEQGVLNEVADWSDEDGEN